MSPKPPMIRLTALAAMLALGACAARDVAEADRIDGIDWKLISVNGLAYPYDVSLRLDGDRLSGVLPCNAYSGQRGGAAPSFTASGLDVTEMACADPQRRRAEAEYLALLPRLTSIARDGDGLRMTGPDATLSFARREARGDEVF
ncbi:META domain-containing protein [Paracoccus isoporae]|nr:META domain-containing protein [Paracoccus isoporae]